MKAATPLLMNRVQRMTMTQRVNHLYYFSQERPKHTRIADKNEQNAHI